MGDWGERQRSSSYTVIDIQNISPERPLCSYPTTSPECRSAEVGWAAITYADIPADVGGFFGDPSHEILVRWYQAGAFMPFFRAHAHIDTKRREPFLYDEPIRGYLRDAIRLRYQLLPVWYNAFHDASVSGAPIIK
jgi:hypothetical protein